MPLSTGQRGSARLQAFQGHTARKGKAGGQSHTADPDDVFSPRPAKPLSPLGLHTASDTQGHLSWPHS